MSKLALLATLFGLAGMGAPNPERVLTIERTPEIVPGPLRKKDKTAPWMPKGDPERPTDRHNGPHRRRTKRSVRVAKAKARIAAAKARRLNITGHAPRGSEGGR